jgi:hypothetical protein
MAETPMRHVSAIAATTHPRRRHHQQPENGMMVARWTKHTNGICIPAQIGNAATTEDMPAQMPCSRRPPTF